MRKIIFMVSVSLDGFFEGPDRQLNLRLAETRACGSGVVLLRYERPDALGR
jgi:hypothetical protein